jgi:hypothetical protein
MEIRYHMSDILDRNLHCKIGGLFGSRPTNLLAIWTTNVSRQFLWAHPSNRPKRVTGDLSDK